jgi:transcription elongation factor GreA
LQTDEDELYTICGTLESEPENELITVHSPLAKSMFNKMIEDKFILKLPNEKNIWTKKEFIFS